MPKSITDIIPPSRRRAMENEGANPLPPSMGDMQAPPPPPPPPRYDSGMGSIDTGKRFPYAWVIAAVVVIAVSIGAVFLSGGAKVEVSPVVSPVSISGDFAATPSSGDLPFEVITVEQVGSKEVKAEGTENANDPAQGSVTVYNAQEKPQELIKNTRFQTPDGLIFRIRDSITVPAGSAAAPGELVVTVYADAGGESYNIGPSTFTLPGLAGSATFEKVYAKSSGSMAGGFTGQRPSVSAATREAQVPGIEESLRADLGASVAGRVPEGYVLVPGATFFSFSPMPDAAGDADSVKVQLQGSATAFVFPKDALAKAIAYRTIGAYAGQGVTLSSAEGLAFATPEGTVPSAGVQSLSFLLSGNAEIIWVIDSEKISGSIAGKTRDAARTLLASYPEIEKASLVLKPFWENTLPQDPAEIEVVIKTPERE